MRSWYSNMSSVLIVCLVSSCGHTSGKITPEDLTGSLSVSAHETSHVFFGMHIHRALNENIDDDRQKWPKIKFGAWRLWDAGVAWLDLEPKKGHWQFEKLDRYIELAQRQGVQVLLTLGQTPRWASARPNEPGPYGQGCAAEAREIADWENYVRKIVTRYKGRIEAYELWNEPDFLHRNPTGFYSGKPEKMVDMARVAYRVIKEIDPRAVVTTPAVVAEVERLEPYFRLGGYQYADVVAAHFYVLPTEHLPSTIQKFKLLMTKYGLAERQLWNTESGFLIEHSSRNVKAPMSSGVFGVVLSQQQAAANIAQFLILAKANGLTRNYWYAWDNFDMGLVGNESGAPNEAGRAYDRVVNWLSDAKDVKCTLTARSISICTIARKNGIARIVWAREEILDWQPPSEWASGKYQTLIGNSTHWNGTNVKLGIAPLYFE